MEICTLKDLVSHDLLLLGCNVLIHFGLTVLNELVNRCLLLMTLYPWGTHPPHGVYLGRIREVLMALVMLYNLLAHLLLLQLLGWKQGLLERSL